ncbi:MAG TPA: AraC family transcriptional regulator [Anaerolineales bacterium]|nr:AraC family transcriptional regulator [Anaerolineales bacterium]
MQTNEWTKITHNAQLNLAFLHAHYVQHAYPRHTHDYYVISLIERGRQSFTHKGTKHFTPPGGVILINPGEVHTGEAVDGKGFELRSLYPTTAHMEMAAFELTGRHQPLPFFKDVRVDHPSTMRSVLSLHKALSLEASELECESRFLSTLGLLIGRYADASPAEERLGKEKKAIRQACDYIEGHSSRGLSLKELAQHVALSPFYFLRLFRAEVGMPPYTYLESVRVRHAQRLIESGKPLAEVALEAGFSSQSHMTRHFKNIIGVTPGKYAQYKRPEGSN